MEYRYGSTSLRVYQGLRVRWSYSTYLLYGSIRGQQLQHLTVRFVYRWQRLTTHSPDGQQKHKPTGCTNVAQYFILSLPLPQIQPCGLFSNGKGVDSTRALAPGWNAVYVQG